MKPLLGIARLAPARRKDYSHGKQRGSEPLSSISYVLIVAGLLFGAATALIGFVGLLGAWFHRSLGSPLPLPTLQRASDRRITMWVGLAGFLLWAGLFLISLRATN
jgi:hypothetical protein